jgi:hypothetical protein
LAPEGFVEIVRRRDWMQLDERILPKPSDGVRKECAVKSEEPPDTPLLEVETKPCGLVVLTNKTWEDHICVYHPEVQSYLDRIRLTLEEPTFLYQTPYTKPTYGFYRWDLLADVPRYKDCYVAVFVRYAVKPAQVCTAYFPARLSPNAGTLVPLRR